MKRKWIKIFAAAMCIIMAAPMIGSAASLDLDQACSLTVEPSGPELADDLKDVKIVYDLYKVAAMEDAGGYYSYRITDDFKALNEKYVKEGLVQVPQNTQEEGDSRIDTNKKFWEELSQEAAKIALDFNPANVEAGGTEGDADSTGKVESNSGVAGKIVGTDKPGEKKLSVFASGSNQEGKTISKTVNGDKLDAGLYLLIARGKDIDGMDIEEYITTIPVEISGDGVKGKKENIVTVAYSEQYVYSFAPQLIAIPTKDADEDGVVSTAADNGDWIYDPTIILKPGQSERYGYLEIVKDLLTYESFKTPAEEAVFVFQVEAELNGKSVYSDVKTLVFTGAGKQSIMIDEIPVGAKVTVTEVYSGASYTLESVGQGYYDYEKKPGNDSDIYKPTADENLFIYSNMVASVKFTNDYNERQTGGHGVVNRFEFDETKDDFADNAKQIGTNSLQNGGNP